MLTRRRRTKAVRFAKTLLRMRLRRIAVTIGAGIITLIAMQFPIVEQTMLGNPDRAMVNTAFKLRADLLSGDGDPVLFIDFDDRAAAIDVPQGAWPRAPQHRTNRELLHQVLEFIRTAPPEEAPGAVMMDVDLATAEPEDPTTSEMMRGVFDRWSKTPSAPLLVMARQAFPAQALDLPGNRLIVPVTEYDDIVGRAPNIFYGSVKVLADQTGMVGDFVPFECVQTPHGPDVLYSAVLLLYAAMERGEIPKDAPVKKWLENAPKICAEAKGDAVPHMREQINYHISMEMQRERVYPDLHPSWNGNGRCHGGDRTVFRRLSAADVAAAGLEGSRQLLCGRLVIIGGSNLAQADWQQTPLNEMPGPVILANSVRGLQLNGGGMRKLSLPWQIVVLIPISLLISTGFAVTRQARREYKRYLRRHPEGNFWVRMRALPFNPVVMNWVLAAGAHYIGVGLLLWSLGWGYWGFLSAPAFASAVAETAQEFADDEMFNRPKKKPPTQESVAWDDTA